MSPGMLCAPHMTTFQPEPTLTCADNNRDHGDQSSVCKLTPKVVNSSVTVQFALILIYRNVLHEYSFQP